MKYEIEFIHKSGKRNHNTVLIFGDSDAISIAKKCFEYGKKDEYTDYVIRKMKDELKDIYPLTIIRDRYNGTYSGGRYLAFNLDFDDVPLEVIGDDVETANFFYKTKIKYGKGATIMGAVNDLIRKGVDE